MSTESDDTIEVSRSELEKIVDERVQARLESATPDVDRRQALKALALGGTALGAGGVVGDQLASSAVEQAAAADTSQPDIGTSSTPVDAYLGWAELADAAKDPADAGEITRNGKDVKVYSGGGVRNLSNIGGSSGALSDSGTDNSDGGDIYQLPQAEDSIDGQGGAALNNFEQIEQIYIADAGGLQTAIDAANADGGGYVKTVPGVEFSPGAEITVKKDVVLDMSGSTVHLTSDHSGFFMETSTRMIVPDRATIDSNLTWSTGNHWIALNTSRTGSAYSSGSGGEVIIEGRGEFRGGSGPAGTGLKLVADGSAASGTISVGNKIEMNIVNCNYGVELITKNDGVTSQAFINGLEFQGHIGGCVKNIYHHDDGGGSPGPARSIFNAVLQPDTTVSDYGIHNSTGQPSVTVLGYGADNSAYNNFFVSGDDVHVIDLGAHNLQPSSFDSATSCAGMVMRAGFLRLVGDGTFTNFLPGGTQYGSQDLTATSGFVDGELAVHDGSGSQAKGLYEWDDSASQWAGVGQAGGNTI